jgi:restriction system protein
MTNAWVIRAGRIGEREQFNLERGFAGGGFGQVGDLSGCTSREDIRAQVAAADPGAKPGRIANHTGQLNVLRNRLTLGDLVVMPLHSSPAIAIGRLTGGYEFHADPDPEKRHVVLVEWLRTDIPRTAIMQDLLFILGGAMAVFQISHHDGARRIEQLLKTGTDPGVQPGTPVLTPDSDTIGESGDAAPVDLERVARDRLTAVIAERFAGHRMERLVAAVLTAEGYVCDVSPEGPDGGVDILAARGPLGLDPPFVVVQVKSGTQPVDAPTLQQLHGALTTHGGKQGLLVAWGGITTRAKQALATQRFTIHVWNADDLIDAVCRAYDRLPEEMQAALALKQVWIYVESEG